MATIDKGAKKSIGIMAALIGAAVVVVFVGVTMIKTSMSSSGSKASVPIAGNDENKPLSGADSDYNDKLKVVDADAAKKAKSDGGTYIPISSGIEEDANTPAVTTGVNAGVSSSGIAATNGNKLVSSATVATAGKVTGTTETATTGNKPALGSSTDKVAGAQPKPNFVLPSFPADPNAPQPPPPAVTSAAAAAAATNNGQGQSAEQRSAVLDQIYSQEEKKKRDEINEKRITVKMTRIGQIAEFLAKNDEYSPIKPSASWIKTSSSPAPLIEAASSPVETKPLAEETMVIKSGEKVYVNIETSIDTDEPSTVFGQVLSGKAKGWMIFGKATQNPNYTVSIMFDTLVLPSGKSAKINAMAIDPNTGRTSVQGTVDHKIFDRFVLPMVAGGLGAFGDLMSKQGTTTTLNPLTGAPMSSSNNMDMAQIRNASIGTGVKSVTTNITKESDKATPSTSTKRNLGIEVIFMQEVMMQ